MPKKPLHDITPKVRQAFTKAIARIGNGDGVEGLTKILEKEIIENPIGTLNVISRYLPREQNISAKVEHDHKHTHEHKSVSESAAFIADIVGDGQSSALKKSMPH